ncbi:DUF6233 domain-containing protein [Streptomyces sp. NPDC058691]|uniref:DUF6233 domain-containing protein n=1 Tax=Streptomyces sp. NPDC058691 TaxID=3346601 RepID=UPI00365E54D7
MEGRGTGVLHRRRRPSPDRAPWRLPRAIRDISTPATTEQAHATLQRPDAAPCPVCRPDRVLLPSR